MIHFTETRAVELRERTAEMGARRCAGDVPAHGPTAPGQALRSPPIHLIQDAKPAAAAAAGRVMSAATLR